MIAVESPTNQFLRAHQFGALRRLLRVVGASNRYYRPILANAGLDGDVASLEDFFARMPFTRKSALIEDQRRHPPYGTNLTYPLETYCRFHQTSGTSGTPLRWLDTHESWQWMLDNWKQVFGAAGVLPGDRLFFAFSFGPFLGFWTAFDAASQFGCLCLPGGGMSSTARLEAMRDNRATALFCTPTYAMRLAEAALAERFDLGSIGLRTIIVAGEPGGSSPVVRGQIERAWRGAHVFDHHGMTEVGPVSYQCPESPGTLMVIETSYLAEIIDPDGDEPAPRGEVGELVLTTLGRLGSPLIRYRTGDLVREDLEIAERFGHPEMALKGGILGRTDDMVLVRGVNVFPAAVDDVLRSFNEVADYQVLLENRGTMTEMRVQIEPVTDTGDGRTLAAQIEARMRAVFNLRVPVTISPSGTLPRFEMKAQRWIRGK